MADLVREWKKAVHDPEVATLKATIETLQSDRLSVVRQIDNVIWNIDHGTVTVEEHERAWRNVREFILRQNR